MAPLADSDLKRGGTLTHTQSDSISKWGFPRTLSSSTARDSLTRISHNVQGNATYLEPLHTVQ